MRHAPSCEARALNGREAGRRVFLTATAALAAAVAWAWPSAAQALGSRVDVQMIDRETADTLALYPYRGQHFVAGRPGSRYAIRITNRTNERVMAVMAVDGVNIVTGQTADWGQSGYVLAPWQSYDITGWRKSDQEVAAFEFTSLPDSYAARTGRPDDVGVIGVAVFNERVYRPAPPPMPQPAPAPSLGERSDSRRSESANGAPSSAPQNAPQSAAKSAQAAQPAAESMASAGAARDAAPEPAERLGTGHGARESSYVNSTSFVRSSSRPMELVSIRYDRYESLVRAGVIPQYGWADPNPRPFPKSSRSAGYVPDPPSR